jgi:C1A family cysteine protease
MALKKETRPGVKGPKYMPSRWGGYGWKPDLPDQRDFTYAAPRVLKTGGQTTIDLRPQCPPVYDQGHIGSCTANAIAGALEFDMMKQGESAFTPSRLFIYYNERAMEGHVPSDSGAYIRDGIKSVATQGDCPETMWTYDDTPADQITNLFPAGAKAATQPTSECYAEAVKHEALNYLSVDRNLADMKACLAEGFPFVYGFTVYESFESAETAQTGWVSMPKSGEKVLGGHAVLSVGYDDDDRVFICRNSWGPRWGDQGYFYMPYAYLLDDNLSDDFWTIRLVM